MRKGWRNCDSYVGGGAGKHSVGLEDAAREIGGEGVDEQRAASGVARARVRAAAQAVDGVLLEEGVVGGELAAERLDAGVAVELHEQRPARPLGRVLDEIAPRQEEIVHTDEVDGASAAGRLGRHRRHVVLQKGNILHLGVAVHKVQGSSVQLG